MRPALLVAVALWLAACNPPARPQEPSRPVAPPLPALTADVAQTAAPLVLEAIEAVAEVLPPAPPVAAPAQPLVDPAAVALIVRWEVTSRAVYAKRYRGVIWPGGASGPTWGVGYDGGHMTRDTIRDDWAAHTALERLLETSGVRGQRAKAELHRWRGVLTEYDYAYLVFSTRSLIEYERLARRTFRKGWDGLHPKARGALVSLVYNRGAGMTGDSRREMRVLRDECVPDADYRCMADAIRSMCRLWAGTPNGKGLCARRNSEAALAESV